VAWNEKIQRIGLFRFLYYEFPFVHSYHQDHNIRLARMLHLQNRWQGVTEFDNVKFQAKLSVKFNFGNNSDKYVSHTHASRRSSPVYTGLSIIPQKKKISCVWTALRRSVFHLLVPSFIQKILYWTAAKIWSWSPTAILWQSKEWVKKYNHPLHLHRCLYNVQNDIFYCMKIDFEILLSITNKM
jgi:hypothetical protein